MLVIMKKLLLFATLLLSLPAAENVCAQEAAAISDIEQTKSWIYVYDAQGHKLCTRSVRSTGDVVAWTYTFFITRSLNGMWYYLYTPDGKRYKALSASSIGKVISASGATFTTRKGNWMYTYDRSGKRINSRPVKPQEK